MDTPNPRTQYRYTTATTQVPIIQDIIKIKTKLNAQTITKVYIRRKREETVLNTGDRR